MLDQVLGVRNGLRKRHKLSFERLHLREVVAPDQKLHLVFDRFEITQLFSLSLSLFDDFVIDAPQHREIAPVNIGEADDHRGKPWTVAGEMFRLQARPEQNARIGVELDPVEHFAQRRAPRQKPVLDDEGLLARGRLVVDRHLENENVALGDGGFDLRGSPRIRWRQDMQRTENINGARAAADFPNGGIGRAGLGEDTRRQQDEQHDEKGRLRARHDA